ncbi:MAG: hypothetical protein M0018_04655, partial [Nitrospiraceae bacterium]|nr:hypothetical protein [Nitrospiraceae bacterium]
GPDGQFTIPSAQKTVWIPTSLIGASDYFYKPLVMISIEKLGYQTIDKKLDYPGRSAVINLRIITIKKQ